MLEEEGVLTIHLVRHDGSNLETTSWRGSAAPTSTARCLWHGGIRFDLGACMTFLDHSSLRACRGPWFAALLGRTHVETGQKQAGMVPRP